MKRCKEKLPGDAYKVQFPVGSIRLKELDNRNIWRRFKRWYQKKNQEWAAIERRQHKAATVQTGTIVRRKIEAEDLISEMEKLDRGMNSSITVSEQNK